MPGCYLSHGLEDERLDGGRLDGGRDVDAPRDVRPVDTGPDVARDGGAATCLTTIVLITQCSPGCDPTRDPLWYFTEVGCVPAPCGECVGPCVPPTTTFEACHDAHRHCTSELCRDTGGVWVTTAEECHHRVCGRPGPVDCEVGTPVCDCGPLAVFEEGVGCVPSDECVAETGSGAALCTATGGTWGPTCCDSRCGEPCGDDCSALACTCGFNEVFDPTLGCVSSGECFERQPGETCGAVGRYCIPPFICCDDCREPPCTGNYRCIDDVCDVGVTCPWSPPADG